MSVNTISKHNMSVIKNTGELVEICNYSWFGVIFVNTAMYL